MYKLLFSTQIARYVVQFGKSELTHVLSNDSLYNINIKLYNKGYMVGLVTKVTNYSM